ncbi:subtilisin-like protein [Ophiobolus disseminans]|uniref:Subtilisin-like protein n=1 Tax=Ophiobolus disseminans TaxID=1469910 RepID=A0A6A7AE96_9PLEO|nr:subtilisin-like protein [Ophiobolus disseminans]
MRFLCISLLCAQVAYSSSIPAPNIQPRSSSSSRVHPLVARDTLYIVYPTDVNNVNQVSETENFLKAQYGADDIIIDKVDGKVVHWRINLKDGDSTDKLKQYPGLSTFEPTDHQTGLVGKAKRSNLVRRDRLSTYMAFAVNADNTDQTAEIFELLKSKSSHPEDIHQFRLDGKVIGWGSLDLSDADKASLETHPGIAKPIQRNIAATPDFIASEANPRSLVRYVNANLMSTDTKQKRTVKWAKQEGAVKDLRMVSQPKDMDLEKMKDFVYDERAGEGILVYVVDQGVQINVENDDNKKEFPNLEIIKGDTTILQGAISKRLGLPPDVDGDPSDEARGTHGTVVASKAVDAKYGIAKKATLIPVKTTPDYIDILDGFERIIKDLEKAPGRALRAVVVFSTTLEEGLNYETALDFPQDQAFHNYLVKIMNLGTPIVNSAGNGALRSLDMDGLPQVFTDELTPLINVGSADFAGKRWYKSQEGTQLTTYGPGFIVGQSRTNKKDFESVGTSYSAPIVAGVIAAYMSSEQPPWDTSLTGIDRVLAIKAFIKSEDNDKTAWARPGEKIKVIWNGADKEAHKSVGANTCASPSSRIKRQDSCDAKPAPPSEPPKGPAPKCNDFGPKKLNYVTQAMVLPLLDDFCTQAATQGGLDKDSSSLTRIFNRDAIEHVEIAMDWERGRDFKPDETKCKHYMKDVLVGDCDRENNDWASGGEITIDSVKYRWHTPNNRAKPVDQFAKWGKCWKSYKGLYDEYDINAAGWEGDNFGNELYQNLKGKGISPSKWKFNYRLGEDGSEWRAEFQTIIGAVQQVEASVEAVARNGPGGGFDFEC